jgi:enoyl-CoA hydratase/carnithine racemase
VADSKVLVCALNGGAIGAGAGFIGCCDFIYAVDDAFLMAPFTS